jgi:Pentapeptide repeats (9 copies)
MSDSFDKRIERFSPWMKDPDRAVWRIVISVIVVAILITVALWIVWVVPRHEVAPYAKVLAPEKTLELENEFRKTLTQIVLSIFGLFLVYLTWRRSRAGDRTVEIAEQGHITDRYTKAIEQLGKLDGDKPNIEVRLGAIYALERIARDSPRDHWTIMEVLTAYVRQNAPVTPAGEAPTTTPLRKPRTDIQAILTVLGRRPISPKREGPEHRLDLSFTHLQGAYLKNANLNDANFYGANLWNANFLKAELRKVDFLLANLEHANLWSTQLQGADFNGAKLGRASFADANLEDAFLGNADLRQASIEPEQIKTGSFWQDGHYSPEMREALGLAPEMP